MAPNKQYFHSFKWPLLLLILMCVWFFGPLIAIADFKPLASMWLRSAIIAATLAGCYFSWAKKSTQLSTYINAPKKFRQALILCEKRFVSAIEFLRKTDLKDKKGKLIDLPWYLVLGPEDSGKSSLLSNSKLKILLSKKNKAEDSQHCYCDWWATDKAILLECNSSYFIQEKKSPGRIFWKNFLGVLQKYNPTSINGVIINLSVEELILESKQRQKFYFHNLKKTLIDMQRKFKTDLPVYIIFSKADCLSGFNEFFDLLTEQERSQLWGISFNKQNIIKGQNIVDTFDTEFDILLNRLNDRLINRLQQESSPQKSAVIKDFPLQIETLKKPLILLIKTIAETTSFQNKTKLRGLYFTSANPQEKTIDRLMEPLSKSFALSTHVEKEAPVFQRSFFCNNLFNEAIFTDSQYFNFKQIQRNAFEQYMRPLTISTGALVVVVAAAFWFKSFNAKISTIGIAQEKIAQYKLLSKDADFTQANKALPALNLLAETMRMLDMKNHNNFADIGTAKQQQLVSAAHDDYISVMEIFLSAQLQGFIYQQIQQPSASVSDLYSALKVYLMLGLPEHFDQKAITTWFNNLWQLQLSNPKEIQQLNIHLNNYLTKKTAPLDLNQRLINEARVAISQHRPEALVFAIIEHELIAPEQQFKIDIPQGNGLHKFFTLKNNQLSLSPVYSKEYFAYTYEKLIPAATDILQSGNWVLVNSGSFFAKLPKHYINDSSRQFYYNQYIITWENVINSLKITDFSSYEHAIQFIDSLARSDTGVSNLLSVISTNTDITYNNLPTPISIKFQKFNHLFSNYPDNEMLTIRAKLLQLEEYMSNIITAKNTKNAAFNAALIRMKEGGQRDIITNLQQQSFSLPAPLDNWLGNTAENSWKLILQDSRDYLNSTWGNAVVPIYRRNIANRYPLVKQASIEVSEENFTQFFGPNGLTDTYYNHFIKPFVDTSSGEWRWKQLNNASIDLPNETLAQFQRLLLIRNLFYPNNSKHPNTKFVLKASTINPHLNTFIVDIDSQQAEYNKQKLPGSHFVWPGDSLLHSSSYTIIKADGEKMRKTETGLWSWFKLLDNATLNFTQSPNILDITFNADEEPVTMEIISTNVINPFNPELLRQFTCPENLTKTS